jgi:hypothetical protein
MCRSRTDNFPTLERQWDCYGNNWKQKCKKDPGCWKSYSS